MAVQAVGQPWQDASGTGRNVNIVITNRGASTIKHVIIKLSNSGASAIKSTGDLRMLENEQYGTPSWLTLAPGQSCNAAAVVRGNSPTFVVVKVESC